MSTSDFAMTVSAVFVLAGRGVVACGAAIEGECRSGSVVQIWSGDQLIGQTVAFVELHARPGEVGLLLTGPNVQVQPGYSIKSMP
jgi:hypothetical protein